MMTASERKLIVKHTFLELVNEERLLIGTSLRQRSRTEGDACSLLSRGSDSTSCGGSDTPDDLDHVSPTLMPSTPEFSPCPQYSAAPMIKEDTWGEFTLPAPFTEEFSMHQYVVPCADRFIPPVFSHQFISSCSWPDHLQRHCWFANPSIAEDPGLIRSKMTERRTTVMLKGLPEEYTRSDLLTLLDSEGFFGRLDFIYVPIDFKKQKNLGYALVNAVSPSEAVRLSGHFEGFSNWRCPCPHVCEVAWSNPHQGLQTHVERYKNSPVMHHSVPKEWRPLLLSHGMPIVFPAPTMDIKAPKLKARH